jgi:hypothetical protein
VVVAVVTQGAQLLAQAALGAGALGGKTEPVVRQLLTQVVEAVVEAFSVHQGPDRLAQTVDRVSLLLKFQTHIQHRFLVG